VNRYLVLLFCTLLAAGCTTYDFQADLPETKNWPAADIAHIDLPVDNGAVLVRAGSDSVISAIITKRCKGTSKADAEVHLVDITTGDSTSGTTLYLWNRVPQPNTRSYTTEYEITAPPATMLHLATANGAVDLDSMTGAAVVIASNGAVRTKAHAGSIGIEAENGAIDCDFAALGLADTATLHSSNGRVTAYLPVGASVAFDIETENGVARVEGFTIVNYSRNEATHKTGTIGTGAATLRLRSENGNVVLQAK
jgi:hypothetical protein